MPSNIDPSLQIQGTAFDDLRDQLQTAKTEITALMGGGGGAAADSLMTTGAAVDVHAAIPPISGQVLTATDPTHATWQTPKSYFPMGW